MGILVLACQTNHLIPGHEPALGIKSEASSIHRTQNPRVGPIFLSMPPHSVSFFLGERERERDEEDNLGQSIVQVPIGTHRDFPSCPALSYSFHLPPPPLFRIYLCHVRFYGPLSHECTCLPPFLY